MAEYDHPHTLLSDRVSKFYATVTNLGEEEKKRIVAIAKDAYYKKYKMTADLDKNHKEEINKALNVHPLFELREGKKSPSNSVGEDENAKDDVMEKSFEEKHSVKSEEARDNDKNVITNDVHENCDGTEAYVNEAYESEA